MERPKRRTGNPLTTQERAAKAAALFDKHVEGIGDHGKRQRAMEIKRGLERALRKGDNEEMERYLGLAREEFSSHGRA